VHQNPGQPSFASPLIADSSWTIRNESGRALTRPLLVFTSVDPQDAYPIALPPTGLDSDLLAILRYSFQDRAALRRNQLPDLALASAECWCATSARVGAASAAAVARCLRGRLPRPRP
jgi:hypothetical protein